MAEQEHFSGGIDKILRQLKPKNTDIPPESPKKLEPLADYKAGNIDAILASLKPKPSSRPIDPASLKIPCISCQSFDLSDMDAGYALENTMCPSCREKSHATTAVQHVQQSENDPAVAANVAHAGAQQTVNEPESAKLTGSALAHLEHEIAGQAPVTYAQEGPESYDAYHQTAPGSMIAQLSTTGFIRGRMQNLELSVATATSWPDSSNLTPKAQLEKRKAVARTKMEVARRQKELDDELERTKADIARKEIEKAKGKK